MLKKMSTLFNANVRSRTARSFLPSVVAVAIGAAILAILVACSDNPSATPGPRATLSAVETAGDSGSDITLTFTGLDKQIAKYWWVVLPDGEDPTEAQVRAGQNATGVAITLPNGTGNSDDSGVTIDAPTTDAPDPTLLLDEVGDPNRLSGDREVFIVVEDADGNSTLLTASFTTDSVIIFGCAVVETDPGDCDGDTVVNSVDEFDNDRSRSCTATFGNADSGTADCDNDGSKNNDDVDDDNDGLIEINFLEDLDKIRNDLDGNGEGSDAIGTVGAPEGGLRGYELSRALDFADAASYRGAAGTGAGQIDATDGVRTTWCPAFSATPSTCIPNPIVNLPSGSLADDVKGFPRIGGSFTAILDGNLFTINNLYMNYGGSTVDDVGLFSQSNGATIRRLGLTNAFVSGRRQVGGLVGDAVNSTLRSVWVTTTAPGRIGSIRATDTSVSSLPRNLGGLAGRIERTMIIGSWANVDLTGSERIGGLVGEITGRASIQSKIALNYARSRLTIGATGSGARIGGLYGNEDDDATLAQSSWSVMTIVTAPSGSMVADGDIIGPWGNAPNPTPPNIYWEGPSGTAISATRRTMAQMQAAGGANFGSPPFGTDCDGAWIFAADAYPKLQEVITPRFASNRTNCTGSVYGAELPGQ